IFSSIVTLSTHTPSLHDALPIFVDDSLPKGDEKVVTPGRVGERVVTYTATMVDGEEVDREILTEIVVADAVDEVIHIGMKEVPDAPDVEPGSNRELGRKMAAERGWGDDEF